VSDRGRIPATLAAAYQADDPTLAGYMTTIPAMVDT
jgi:hypothetical protein